MLLKIEYKYSIDRQEKYTLIDNIDSIDVGCDIDSHPHRNFIKVYKKDRKGDLEHSILYADDVIFYVMNDQGKTLQIIRPSND